MFPIFTRFLPVKILCIGMKTNWRYSHWFSEIRCISNSTKVLSDRRCKYLNLLPVNLPASVAYFTVFIINHPELTCCNA